MQRNIEIKDIENNQYYKNNKELFLELLNILKNNKRVLNIIQSNKNIKILEWINTSIPLLQDNFYTIQTKIYWIINNLSNFPICLTCGKKLEHRNVFRIFNPQYSYCNIKCRNNNKNIKNKIKITINNLKQSDIDYQKKINIKRKITCRAKYGVDSILQLADVQEKIKQIKKEKYGNENYVNIQKIKQTKFKKYGDANYCNIEKIQSTCLKNFGVKNPFEAKEIKQKILNTKKEKLKNDPLYKQKINKKIQETKLKKYNNPNYNNIEKQKDTINKKILEDPYFWHKRKIKTKYTCLKKI